jgi:hypothetical protein
MWSKKSYLIQTLDLDKLTTDRNKQTHQNKKPLDGKDSHILDIWVLSWYDTWYIMEAICGILRIWGISWSRQEWLYLSWYEIQTQSWHWVYNWRFFLSSFKYLLSQLGYKLHLHRWWSLLNPWWILMEDCVWHILSIQSMLSKWKCEDTDATLSVSINQKSLIFNHCSMFPESNLIPFHCVYLFDFIMNKYHFDAPNIRH